MIQWMFRDLDDNAPMSTERLERFIPFMDKLLRTEFPHKLPEGLRAWLDARTKDEELVRAARQRLVEYGLPEAQVRRFPADQVILLDEKREFVVRFDDVMKTINSARLAGRGGGPPVPVHPGAGAVRRFLRAGGRKDHPVAREAGPADRPLATRRSATPLRRGARRQTAREPV